MCQFQPRAVYFDIGNVVRFGWPQHWIQTLGKRIGQLDIKEYSREKQKNEGLWRGFKVEIGDGDCDWPEVREAMKSIDLRRRLGDCGSSGRRP